MNMFLISLAKVMLYCYTTKFLGSVLTLQAYILTHLT